MRADRTRAHQGLVPERVGEVMVTAPGDGAGRRGSGYLVSPGTVPTAAHAVEGAAGSRIQVRFQADRPGEPSPAEFWPATVEALAYAVLDDHETARTVAYRCTAGERRSKTLAALAGYAARVPVDLMVAPIDGDGKAHETTARRQAALLFPPPSGPDLPRARALLAEALTSDGWYHAVLVLAAIDPDAALRVRDAVFAHLGLSD